MRNRFFQNLLCILLVLDRDKSDYKLFLLFMFQFIWSEPSWSEFSWKDVFETIDIFVALCYIFEMSLLFPFFLVGEACVI